MASLQVVRKYNVKGYNHYFANNILLISGQYLDHMRPAACQVFSISNLSKNGRHIYVYLPHFTIWTVSGRRLINIINIRQV